MNHFSCKGYIKITIYEEFTTLFYIEMQHNLHPIRPDVTISSEIKHFILDNIDLLLHKIYKRLVECSLNTNIYQKQIHFWWVELGKNRYKWNENSFVSTIK